MMKVLIELNVGTLFQLRKNLLAISRAICALNKSRYTFAALWSIKFNGNIWKNNQRMEFRSVFECTVFSHYNTFRCSFKMFPAFDPTQTLCHVVRSSDLSCDLVAETGRERVRGEPPRKQFVALGPIAKSLLQLPISVMVGNMLCAFWLMMS